jgi:hypothetical protein
MVVLVNGRSGGSSTAATGGTPIAGAARANSWPNSSSGALIRCGALLSPLSPVCVGRGQLRRADSGLMARAYSWRPE